MDSVPSAPAASTLISALVKLTYIVEITFPSHPMLMYNTKNSSFTYPRFIFLRLPVMWADSTTDPQAWYFPLANTSSTVSEFPQHKCFLGRVSFICLILCSISILTTVKPLNIIFIPSQSHGFVLHIEQHEQSAQLRPPQPVPDSLKASPPASPPHWGHLELVTANHSLQLHCELHFHGLIMKFVFKVNSTHARGSRTNYSVGVRFSVFLFKTGYRN